MDAPPGTPSEPLAPVRSLAARVARRALVARLAGLRGAALVLEDARGRVRLGAEDADLEAHLRVHDAAFYTAVALRGSVGAGESYMDGQWSTDDLPTLVRVLARNAGQRPVDRGAARLAQPTLRLLHALRRNHRRGARRNIAAHYDLGNEFFSLFLDPTLTYSCAVFEREDMSLEEAQRAKIERLCRKLRLGPEDHVLEIGCGWGAFAIHAAREYGCHVTGVTLSREQADLARKRVAEAGLDGRVEIRLCDYRELTGVWDKIVSIEMIEAVGADHLEEFFRVCSARLRPDGQMGLQAILVHDQDWQESRRNVDFVKRYIFPGGQLVSLGAISQAIASGTDLRILHVEDLTPCYAETLLRWRASMHANLDRMRALGLPERFLRMWDFYLAYCAGSFAERAIGVVQLLLARAQARPAPVLGALG